MLAAKGRKILILTLGLMFVISVASIGMAKDYPVRNIEFVCPFSAGGAADVAVRTLAPHLGKALGVNVLPENKEGAGTQIAIMYLLNEREAEEGYIILFATQPHSSNTILIQKAPYKLSDIHWLNFQMIDPLAVNVAPDAPWNNFAELVEYIKENPGKISFGVPQMAGPHLFLEYFKSKLNLDFVIVPYDGGGDARAALIGGHVDAAFTNAQSSLSIKENSKSLGIGWDERTNMWPDTPCFAELFEDKEITETIMALASYRGVAVSRKFKEKYPERYEILLDAYYKAFHSEEHMKDMEKVKLKDVSFWVGPEESQKMAERTHRVLGQLIELLQ